MKNADDMRNRTLNFVLLGAMIVTSVSLSALQNRTGCHSDIQRVLSETDEILVSRFDSIKPSLPLTAEISLMFADLKFTYDSLKFCEFGSVQGAGGHEHATPLQLYEDTFHLKSPYWEFFWQYFALLKLPVWILTPNPAKSKSTRINKDILSWKTYVENGGHWANSIQALKRNKYFMQCKKSNKKFNIADLSTYKGIIINLRCTNDHWKQIYKFRKNNPDFLIVGAQTREYITYKSRGSAIFNLSGLDQFKPLWGKYAAEYKDNLADRIINDIGSDLYVVKPTNSMRARGVFIESKDKLDAALKKILDISREHVTTYGFWKKKRKSIHVEEYCPSKTIKVDGKRYDPTMRVFFALRHSAGKIYTTVFSGFWKVPEKSLDEPGSLTEKHVTVPGDHEKVALKIEQKDLKKVRETLKVILPKLYYTMLKYHGTFEKTASEIMINQGG